MTDAERAVMDEHARYWSALAAEGKVLAFGPVADPEGPYGIAIVLAEDLEAAEVLRNADPVMAAPRDSGPSWPPCWRWSPRTDGMTHRDSGVDAPGTCPYGAGMAVGKVQLFSLPVTDQSRARDFYVGVLGFELVADTSMGPDQRWVQVRPAGAETSITLVTWFESMAPGTGKGTVLESDDLDGDIERLAAEVWSSRARSRRPRGAGS